MKLFKSLIFSSIFIMSSLHAQVYSTGCELKKALERKVQEDGIQVGIIFDFNIGGKFIDQETGELKTETDDAGMYAEIVTLGSGNNSSMEALQKLSKMDISKDDFYCGSSKVWLRTYIGNERELKDYSGCFLTKVIYEDADYTDVIPGFSWQFFSYNKKNRKWELPTFPDHPEYARKGLDSHLLTEGSIIAFRRAPYYIKNKNDYLDEFTTAQLHQKLAAGNHFPKFQPGGAPCGSN